ncbi:MAG: hypothetical protein WC247_13930 [Porticoccaceae bacterium]
MSYPINVKFIGAALVAFALLAGCEKGPAEKTGEAIDDAARESATQFEDTSERLKESAEQTRDCIDSNMENC